jgi:hypothetical protein
MIKRKIWVAAGLALSLTTGVYASEGEAGEGGPKPADSADKFYSATGQRDVPFGKALENGMLVRATGDILALSPPLIISKIQIEEIAQRLRAAVDAAA